MAHRRSPAVAVLLGRFLAPTDPIRTVPACAWSEFEESPAQWATQEAAIAAKPHFKEWVDVGMNAHRRTAQAASAVARAAAAKSAAANPRLPVRFRGGVRLESAT
eukprot:5575442-Prymnesium_polylepis.1